MSHVSISDYKFNVISREAPWQWLAAGWKDLMANKVLSLSYGFAFTLVSVLLLFGLVEFEMAGIVFALAAGFLLLGPMFGMGLYEASRRLENRESVSFENMLFVRAKSPLQLLYLGLVLLLMFMVWVRIAALLYALFFGMMHFPPLSEFIPTLLYSWEGPTMLALGTIIGGIIAFSVFAVTVISAPLLMHRRADVMTAIILSVKAVRMNFWPMALWAWLIAWFMTFAIATAFIGMIIVFPLLGHATWHAYRSLAPSRS